MNKINVSAKYSPLPVDEGEAFLVEKGKTISEIIMMAPNVPDYFWDYGVVIVNDKVIPRDVWDTFVPLLWSPGVPTLVEMRVVPQGGSLGGGGGGAKKNVVAIIASIALIAATAFIGGGGLALLGAPAALFGAATLGASLTAAAVGAAGSLAIMALTPPPVTPGAASSQTGGQLDKPSAGIGQNAIAPLQPFPAVRGFARLSPVIGAPPYLTLDDQIVSVNVILLIAGGPYDLSDILIDGNAITDTPNVEYELHYGYDDDADDMTLVPWSVIENRNQGQMSNFLTELQRSNNDLLVHQSDPDSDLPQPKIHHTKMEGDKYVFQLLWPGGMVKVNDNTQAVTPIRIQGRLVGGDAYDAHPELHDWINFPEFHFTDPAKTASPIRQKIEILFDDSIIPTDATQTNLSNTTDDRPAVTAFWRAGRSKTWEYRADDYFRILDRTANMTAANVPAGYVVSADSEQAGNESWKAFDSNATGTRWQSGNVAGDHWIQIDLPSAERYLSLVFERDGADTGACPDDIEVWGWDGSAWQTVLNRVTGASLFANWLNFDGTIGYYTKYRFISHSTQDNGNDCKIANLRYYNTTVDSVAMDDGGFIEGNQLLIVVAGNINVNSDDGVKVYMDTTLFPKGEWEWKITRGLAYKYSDFDWTLASTEYQMGGNTDTPNFFQYSVAAPYSVTIGQLDYRSDCGLEVTQTVSYDYPLDLLGKNIAAIAMKIPSKNVNSISVFAKSIVPTYDGATWSNKGVSNNPAELYRDILLGNENGGKIPGEIIGEERLLTWWAECVAQGYECNLVVEPGDDAYSILKQIAATGWAFPRQSDKWDVIYEYDRSAEPITQLFTSLNSKHVSTDINYPEKLHAIRAMWNNEDDNYATAETIIYGPGYNEGTATNIETFPYPGITNELAVINRAELDHGQLLYRQVRYVRDISAEYLMCMRGDLVGLNDDILVEHHRSSYIKSIQYDDETASNRNIVGVALEAEVDLTVDEVGSVDDVGDVGDVTSISANRGIVIRCTNNTYVHREINESTMAKVITFVDPVPDDGTIEPLCLCTLGLFEQEYSRKLVLLIEPGKDLTARVTLVDEAPEIHQLRTGSLSGN